ncbi:MAG: glutathione peroxidase [Phycisphaerales bacterium]|nr:MAG: glutathione peroxidase [Phycisphaerales bacterium]
MQVLDFTMNRIDGTPQDLAEFRGDVVLIVNTASRCGMTPQYRGLEDLYREKKDEGFVVLGFPANNFMGQEPGTDEDIAAFCERNYGVTFPLFSKIIVKGDDMHPLYKRLTSQPAPVGGEIQWNFDKFLVDRQGRVVARFGPRTAPTDPAFVEAVEGLLAEASVGG